VATLEVEEAGDDLEIVLDPVVYLLQQHFFLAKRRPDLLAGTCELARSLLNALLESLAEVAVKIFALAQRLHHPEMLHPQPGALRDRLNQRDLAIGPCARLRRR
jgi:hypothetical protein